jgi:hypothetical protein
MRQIRMPSKTPDPCRTPRWFRARLYSRLSCLYCLSRLSRSGLIVVLLGSGLAIGANAAAVAVGNPSVLPALYCAFDEEPRTALLSTEGLVVVNGTKATAHQFRSADVAQSKPEYRFVNGPTLVVNEPNEPGNRAALLDASLGACLRAPKGFVPRRVRIAATAYQTGSAKSSTIAKLATQQIVFVGAVKKGWREVFMPVPRANGFGLVVSQGWVKSGVVGTGPLAKI